MELIFFAAPADFRRWLRSNHATATELLVGFYKVGSGRTSMTWPESVDEALCVGWIDGVRRRVDAESYSVRFTPRRRGSIWSAVNVKRMAILTNEKRMRPAGQVAFAARRENKSGIYAYEQRTEKLPEPYSCRLRANGAAWEFFQAQPPSYRKTLGWWVTSAKQETTRLRRLEKLIAASARRERLR
ncbi:MAG: YdeI/OmpD-associated family protein [Chthoniobacterales bacterium]